MKHFVFVILLLVPCLAFAAGDADLDQDLIKELEGYHKQAEQMMQQLQKAHGQEGALSAADKARQKVMQLATDDRFLASAGELWRHPDRNKLLAIQAGFFLLMILVKAWRQSKVNHWFRKLLVGFFFTIVTWIGVAFVIPFFVLGEPFRVFTLTLFNVLVK